MPLDPSIILGVQQPQIENQLDAAGKAMAYKNLAMKTQTDQQEFNDNQAMRNAMSTHTTVDPDGNASVNRTGVMADLAKSSNPGLAVKAQQQFAQTDMALQEQHLKTMQAKLGTTGQLLGGVTDQKSYDNAKKQIIAMNGDVSQLPDEYDPSAVQHAQMWAMDAKSQVEAQQKQQQMGIQQTEANIKTQQLGQEINKNKATQNQETLSALQALRGNPALQRAETNVLSAKNLNDLAEQVRDPKTGQINLNNMNPQQISLANHELLRMASGGTGSETDLENLKPGTPQYRLAELHQKLTGKVSGADAAQYLQQGLDYANTLGKSSNQFLYQNAKHVVDAKRNYLAPQDQQRYDSWLGDMKSGKAFFGDVAPGGDSPGTIVSTGGQTTQQNSTTSHKSLPLGAVSNGYTKTKDGWVKLNAAN